MVNPSPTTSQQISGNRQPTNSEPKATSKPTSPSSKKPICKPTVSASSPMEKMGLSSAGPNNPLPTTHPSAPKTKSTQPELGTAFAPECSTNLTLAHPSPRPSLSPPPPHPSPARALAQPRVSPPFKMSKTLYNPNPKPFSLTDNSVKIHLSLTQNDSTEPAKITAGKLRKTIVSSSPTSSKSRAKPAPPISPTGSGSAKST